MKKITTVILQADEGKTLKNKITGAEAPCVWLNANDPIEEWEEILEPSTKKETIEMPKVKKPRKPRKTTLKKSRDK